MDHTCYAANAYDNNTANYATLMVTAPRTGITQVVMSWAPFASVTFAAPATLFIVYSNLEWLGGGLQPHHRARGAANITIFATAAV